MTIKDVIALIDVEIASLEEARRLLAGGAASVLAKKKPGRPRKVDVAAVPVTLAFHAKTAKKKRGIGLPDLLYQFHC